MVKRIIQVSIIFIFLTVQKELLGFTFANIPEDFSFRYKKIIFEFQKTLSILNKNYKILIIKETHKQKNEEEYTINITEKEITISSPSNRGLIYGISHVENMISDKKNRNIITYHIYTYPKLKIRALHISGPLKKEEVKRLIKLARFNHFNTIVLRIGKPILRKKYLNCAKKEMDLACFLKVKEFLTLKDLLDIVKYTRENGLEFVPQLDLLTHQKTFIADIYPEFMFNKLTYNPEKEEIYQKIVFPILNQLISLIHPKAIHIGHDEVAGWSKWTLKHWLNPGEKMLPYILFYKDVMKIYNFLKKKNIEVWIWGDMLVAPEEISYTCIKAKYAHGTNGYFALRKLLPKDIVICDWHYFESPNCKNFYTSYLFIKDGYRVIGTTWFDKPTAKNFSAYIAQLPKNNLGMMASTWVGALRHKYKNRIKVEDIIKISGNIFWNAGEKR